MWAVSLFVKPHQSVREKEEKNIEHFTLKCGRNRERMLLQLKLMYVLIITFNKIILALTLLSEVAIRIREIAS